MGTHAKVTNKRMLMGILLSLRPKQWTKNVAIFAALVFSQTAAEPTHLARALGAFVIFCLLSGSVYLFNDLVDLEQDKKHPVKCLRPLASGQISSTAAVTAAILIGTLVTGASWMLGINFFVVTVAYLVLQIGYSLRLKHAVILDAFAIAAGFILRVIGGAEAISVEISSWLLVCTMLLALFLAFSKRRHELTSLTTEAKSHRKILAEYSTPLLDQMISVVTSATVVSYCLYTMSEETIRKFHTTRLIYTVPFVLYGVFRYLYLVYKKDQGGHPDVALLTDAPLLISVILYAIAVGLILYT